MIFSIFQKNRVLGYSWSTLLWHRCYYPHRSRDALSPVCGIFNYSLCFRRMGGGLKICNVFIFRLININILLLFLFFFKIRLYANLVYKLWCMVLSFLVFKQLNTQSSSLFLFTIVDKILQTMLVVTPAAPVFHNLMANPADCEWMLNSDCFNCGTSHFRSTALHFGMFLRKR